MDAFDTEVKIHSKIAEGEKQDTEQQELMKQYLEQTQIEVQVELQIVQLEKGLAKLKSKLSETRLTKSNLMHKLKGLPEPLPADSDLAKKLEELLRHVPPFAKDPFRL